MLYSILIYGSEERAAAWTPAEKDEVMDRHAALRADLSAHRRLGPVMRLAQGESKTLRRSGDEQYLTDGPYAETKEQLMGIYVIECPSLDDAVAAAKRLDFVTGVFEITPLAYLDPGQLQSFTPSS